MVSDISFGSTCGCKGIRTCNICNKNDVIVKSSTSSYQTCWFCPDCCVIITGDIQHTVGDCDDISDWCALHAGRKTAPLKVKGIYVQERFISSEEENFIAEMMNREEWKMSQSGRRKQDFGPKVNFKRKKLKVGSFTGLPSYSKLLTERLSQNDILKEFTPVELCNLEYVPERGSSIDPHKDDSWLWGDHLVTINLISRTILTLTHPQNTYEVQIPMSARSLLILYDEARYDWLHGIKPNHVTHLRLAMTFRNLSPEFSRDGVNAHIGDEIRDIAKTFRGSVVK